jgi:hypothetical protein
MDSVRAMAVVVTVVALGLFARGLDAQGASPSEQLKTAEQLFLYQDYKSAAPLLSALLYPKELLGDFELVMKAREYLAACYWFLGDKDAFKEEITGLLSAKPSFVPDPFYYPPELISDFEAQKKRLIELKVISSSAKQDDEEPVQCEEVVKVVEKKTSITMKSRAITFMPFGVGQFYNGSSLLGALFLTGQTVALSANIASYFSIQALRLPGSPYYSEPNKERALTLETVMYVSVGVFCAFYLASVVEANIAFDATTVTKTETIIPMEEDETHTTSPASGQGGATFVIPF